MRVLRDRVGVSVSLSSETYLRENGAEELSMPSSLESSLADSLILCFLVSISWITEV